MAKKKSKKMLEVKRLLSQMEKLKQKIVIERDKLRDIYSELEEVIESCDAGIENINEGMGNIEEGLDNLSQYL